MSRQRFMRARIGTLEPAPRKCCGEGREERKGKGGKGREREGRERQTFRGGEEAHRHPDTLPHVLCFVQIGRHSAFHHSTVQGR